MKYYVLIIMAILSFEINSVAQTNAPIITNLSTEDFKKAISTNPDVPIIDLRTDAELKKGYIPGAKQIDYLGKDFDAQMAQLDKNKTYYIYCQSGGRSSDAAGYMEKQGFKKVITLEKGFSDWKAKGFTVENK